MTGSTLNDLHDDIYICMRVCVRVYNGARVLLKVIPTFARFVLVLWGFMGSEGKVDKEKW